uniref:Uncharacterized protein n=1 Tax=Anguilla anguilla TaxID=7936 RepID=A0A0E9V4B5_ANGAN
MKESPEKAVRTRYRGLMEERLTENQASPGIRSRDRILEPQK